MVFGKEIKMVKYLINKVLRYLKRHPELQVRVFFLLAEHIVKRTDNTLDDELLVLLRESLGDID